MQNVFVVFVIAFNIFFCKQLGSYYIYIFNVFGAQNCFMVA